VNYLAAHGAGKARFLLAAESDEWERSGLDHRIRRTTTILDVTLACPEADEARAIATGLKARGRFAQSLTVESAADAMRLGERCLMDRIAEARGVGSLAQAVGARIGSLDALPDAALLRRAYLATALVHRYGMFARARPPRDRAGPARGGARCARAGPARQEPADSRPRVVRTRHPVVARRGVHDPRARRRRARRDGRRPARRAPRRQRSRTRPSSTIRPS